MSEQQKIRAKLINGGVRALREFGYPDVRSDNIMTDYIYRRFFETQLENTKADLERLASEYSRQAIVVIDAMITEINAQKGAS